MNTRQNAELSRLELTLEKLREVVEAKVKSGRSIERFEQDKRAAEEQHRLHASEAAERLAVAQTALSDSIRYCESGAQQVEQLRTSLTDTHQEIARLNTICQQQHEYLAALTLQMSAGADQLRNVTEERARLVRERNELREVR
jgi:methyl-accepting chemotaxis protein